MILLHSMIEAGGNVGPGLGDLVHKIEVSDGGS